ncbi:MAG: lipopolysaccharide biosynthesis protein, partial [Gemmatimonadales bacterium]
MTSGTGLASGVRGLVGSSAVYGLGSILTRGIAFLLLPVYTRYLAPADYGLVMVTATIVAILGVVYPLGLHGALSRFYFATESPEERRARSGTIWIATLLGAAVMAPLAEVVGPRLMPALLPDVPFSPYARLAIWTAFFATFSLGPLIVLQLQERPGAYVATSLFTTLATTACVLTGVVVLRQGALGYLWGGVVGAALAAIWYSAIAFKNMRLTLRRGVLVSALAYGLPLVPHALAGWVLELSDRAILARFVPLAEVGVYS